MADTRTKIFSGTWLVEVFLFPDADPNEFFSYFINDSDGSDGRHDVVAGGVPLPIVVSGARWELSMALFAGTAATFLDVRTAAAEYTSGGGLVLTVSSGVDELDENFNGLALRCRALDPELNPNPPSDDDPDFSLPDDVFRANQPCPRPTLPGAPGPGHGGLGPGGPGFGGPNVNCSPVAQGCGGTNSGSGGSGGVS